MQREEKVMARHVLKTTVTDDCAQTSLDGALARAANRVVFIELEAHAASCAVKEEKAV